MSDTVFILGAGFSRAAEIPLLGGFVDQMWNLAVRGKAKEVLSEADKKVFADAMTIREELDSYHGRAAFNDRNIEDILSILSFNVLGGGKRERDKLARMSAAIARTIELTCNVQHPGIDLRQGRIVEDGPNLYRDFWAALFASTAKGHQLPAILTFNYDLVLERSLLQTLIGKRFGASNPLPFKRVQVQYHYDEVPPRPYDIRYSTFGAWGDSRTASEGSVLQEAPPTQSTPIQSIEILKLHGSLNFPKKKITTQSTGRDTTLTAAVEDPFIMPPVFNKASGDSTNKMWRIAIERIRMAKNIVIVGYSLPATDIYMQYFLKAGVGPNKNLNKITVYDPVLFTDSASCEAMKARYADCFSPQLRDRIDFQPSSTKTQIRNGTAESFVNTLSKNPGELLF